jgi:hypothetical protein
MVNQDVMLRPADTCVVCEKHLSEIGGYRLTAGGSKGIFICHKADMTKRAGGGLKRTLVSKTNLVTAAE